MTPKAALRTQLILFFSIVLVMSIAMDMHESLFNPFLADTFDLSPDGRGALEMPRELPGFLVVVTSGLLCMLPVTGMGIVGAGLLALGMVGLAFFGAQWWPMVAVMILASTGMHLLMPVGSTIAIALSDENTRGRRMGQMGAVRSIGSILGCGFVWLIFDKTNPQYRMMFLCIAGGAAVAAILYSVLQIPDLRQRRSRMVIRRKFKIYYILELLFGARKQIFITFGPWVLLRIYHEPASGIALLWVIASAIGIVFKPLLGMAIDHFGERAVMVVDGLVLAVVCIGYGYAGRIAPDAQTARIIACGCFVLDNLLFACGTARAVYVSRLTDSPQETTSTLAMGISINHMASMTIPFFAGTVWILYGYERVFLGAAVLAVGISIASSFVPAKRFLRSGNATSA